MNANTLKSRDDVLKIVPGTIITVDNGFAVVVDNIDILPAGDVLICGRVISVSWVHPYQDLLYGDFVYWGPKGIGKTKQHYINGNYVKRT